MHDQENGASDAPTFKNITDLSTVVRLLPFYDVLSRYPPELTVPFLRQAAWQDDLRNGRIAALRDRAARLFSTLPLADRAAPEARFVTYHTTRMVDPLCAHLYGRGARFLNQCVTIDNAARWEAARRQFGRAVLVSPHWGPYLATPMVLLQMGIPSCVLLDADLVAPWDTFLQHYGDGRDLDYRLIGIPGPPASAELAAAVRDGYTPFITPDFNLGRPSRLTAPFLGRRLPATTGPARLALDAGVPVLPVVLTLTSPLRYHLAFGDPLFWPGQDVLTVERLTQKIFAWMETVVQRDPALWWGWLAYNTALTETEDLSQEP